MLPPILVALNVIRCSPAAPGAAPLAETCLLDTSSTCRWARPPRVPGGRIGCQLDDELDPFVAVIESPSRYTGTESLLSSEPRAARPAPRASAMHASATIEQSDGAHS